MSEENITTLETIRKTLQQEIADLESKKKNLFEQNRTEEIRLIGEKKVLQIEMDKKFYERDSEFNKKMDNLKSREESLELKEQKYSERLSNIEKHEQKIGVIEKDWKELDDARKNFSIYKYNIEKELSAAKEIICEAGEKEKELKAREDSLKGLQVSLDKARLQVDYERGQLNEDKKNFELMKNEYKVKEVVNV